MIFLKTNTADIVIYAGIIIMGLGCIGMAVWFVLFVRRVIRNEKEDKLFQGNLQVGDVDYQGFEVLSIDPKNPDKVTVKGIVPRHTLTSPKYKSV